MSINAISNMQRIILAACLASGLAACQSTPDRSTANTSDRTMGNETAARSSMDDSTVTNAVKAKLVAEGTPTLKRVNVTTDHGIVHLSGTVDTAEQKEQASRLAGQVSGVQRVDNALQVSKSEMGSQPDRTLQ